MLYIPRLFALVGLACLIAGCSVESFDSTETPGTNYFANVLQEKTRIGEFVGLTIINTRVNSKQLVVWGVEVGVWPLWGETKLSAPIDAHLIDECHYKQ